jgi:ribonuclease HII
MTETAENKGLFELPESIEALQPVDGWYVERGFRMIAGVDEAGRGALAGPVCAAAVILGDEKIDGLNDSKLLLPEVRNELYGEIWAKARAVGVAMAGSGQIDLINILWASMEAMRLAVKMLPECPDIVLIDGDRVPGGMNDAVAIVKGDLRSERIMAASIIAKVTRDRWMIRAAREYPGYNFEENKGYAVPFHFRALDELGPTPIHRQSFAPVFGQLEGLPEIE